MKKTMHSLLATSIFLASFTSFVTAHAAPGPSPEALARASGCYLCHNAVGKSAGPASKPLAPGWHDIADRYAKQANAEQQLVRVVLDGSGRNPAGRNWRSEVLLGEMPAHRGQLTVDQVQQIVRWVLSSMK